MPMILGGKKTAAELRALAMSGLQSSWEAIAKEMQTTRSLSGIGRRGTIKEFAKAAELVRREAGKRVNLLLDLCRDRSLQPHRHLIDGTIEELRTFFVERVREHGAMRAGSTNTRQQAEIVNNESARAISAIEAGLTAIRDR